jgi:hypothetical protein
VRRVRSYFRRAITAAGALVRGNTSPDDRARRLGIAVATWTQRGWAVESTGASDALLRRGDERVILLVDARGRIRSRATSRGIGGIPSE